MAERKTAAELLAEVEGKKGDTQPQENTDGVVIDAVARMRFKCVQAVMEFGAENDRRNPLAKAGQIFNFVIGKETTT